MGSNEDSAMLGTSDRTGQRPFQLNIVEDEPKGADVIEITLGDPTEWARLLAELGSADVKSNLFYRLHATDPLGDYSEEILAGIGNVVERLSAENSMVATVTYVCPSMQTYLPARRALKVALQDRQSSKPKISRYDELVQGLRAAYAKNNSIWPPDAKLPVPPQHQEALARARQEDEENAKKQK